MTDTARARLVRTPELDVARLDAVQRSLVACVGVGLLGGALVQQLAVLGVPMLLIDDGVVEPANLTQGFGPEHVGRPKTEARAAQLAALNPDCPVRCLSQRIEDVGLAALADADLIVTGLDGRPARASVAAHAARDGAGIPWLDSGVDGSGAWLLGYVALYDSRSHDAACYLCPHDTDSFRELVSEGRGPGCPSWRAPAALPMEPTLTAPALGAIVGGHLALWAVRVLVGRADALVGRKLVIDCDGTSHLELLELTRNPECVSGHTQETPRRAPGAATLGELMAAVEEECGGEADEILFHRRSLVDGLLCPDCGRTSPLTRLAHTISDREATCACGAEYVPATLSERLSRAEALRHAQRGFRELGFPSRDVVSVVVGGRATAWVVNEPAREGGRT